MWTAFLWQCAIMNGPCASMNGSHVQSWMDRWNGNNKAEHEQNEFEWHAQHDKITTVSSTIIPWKCFPTSKLNTSKEHIMTSVKNIPRSKWTDVPALNPRGCKPVFLTRSDFSWIRALPAASVGSGPGARQMAKQRQHSKQKWSQFDLLKHMFQSCNDRISNGCTPCTNTKQHQSCSVTL